LTNNTIQNTLTLNMKIINFSNVYKNSDDKISELIGSWLLNKK